MIYDNFILPRKPWGVVHLCGIYRANISHTAAPISYIKHVDLKQGNAVCISACRDTHVVCVCIWDGVDKSAPQHHVYVQSWISICNVETSSIPECFAQFWSLAVCELQHAWGHQYSIQSKFSDLLLSIPAFSVKPRFSIVTHPALYQIESFYFPCMLNRGPLSSGTDNFLDVLPPQSLE